MIEIWCAGHAQTHDNVAGVASGHGDVALTDEGRNHARTVLRERYANESFDVIFTSDTQRAYDTARLIFEGRGIPIVQDVRLRQCDYGDLTGRPQSEIAAARTAAIAAPFSNGESYQQVAQRMCAFLDDLSHHHDGKRVMIIGHRATFWTLRHWLKSVALADAVGAPVAEIPEIFEYGQGPVMS